MKVKFFTFLLIAIVILFSGCKDDTGGILEIINATDDDNFYVVVFSGGLSLNEVTKKVAGFTTEEEKEKNIKNIKKNEKESYSVVQDGLITYYCWIPDTLDTSKNIFIDFGTKYLDNGYKISVSVRKN